MTNLLTQNYFPDFVPNQILTNVQLNELRRFLDEQNRLTRTRLTGMGIVCGLQVMQEEESGGNCVLSISEGLGITSDGYLIEIPDTVLVNIRNYKDPHVEPITDAKTPENKQVFWPVYERWRLQEEIIHLDLDEPVTQIPIQELLTQAQLSDQTFVEELDNESAPINKADLEGKVLVLYLEMDPKDLKSCLTTDCNNKGQNLHLNVRALLVGQEYLAPVQPCEPLGELVHVPRLHTGLQVSAGLTLDAVSTVSEINNAYQDIAQFLANDIDLADKIETAFDAYYPLLGLHGFEPQIINLQDNLNAVAGAPDFNQYHYDFFKDLAQAYNEFIQLMCCLVKDCCYEGNFPRHLMLKGFGLPATVPGETTMRNYFLPSPVRNVLYKDLEKARKLFLRMLSLVDHFAIPPALATIKITPSRKENVPLGERAMPYYYREGLNSHWPPALCCTPPTLNYSDNSGNTEAPPTGSNYEEYVPNPLHYSILQHDFFRIEGHLGHSCSAAVTTILEQRRQHNLEFNLRLLRLGNSPAALVDSTLDQIMNLWEGIQAGWRQINKLANSPNFNDSIYQQLLDAITPRTNELLTLNQKWAAGRKDWESVCDLAALQSDYLQLRGELFCLLHKMKAVIELFPDAGQPPQDREACVTFEDLPVNEQFGAPDNPAGQRIDEENGIIITVENLTLSTGGTTFNAATILADSSNQFIFLKGISLGFNFTGLEFTPTEVTFEIHDVSSGFQNIAVNGNPVVVGPILNNFNGATIAPGVAFSFVPFDPAISNQGICTVRGNIQTLLIGGQELVLDQVCAKGQTASRLVTIQPPFRVRFGRLQFLCRLLDNITLKDLRCLNYSLFRDVLKQISGTAIEIKLLLALFYRSFGRLFTPYQLYPFWQDLEHCLNHLHFNCLLPRFANLVYTMEHFRLDSGEDFQRFVRHFPGLEHQAGVPKGGTFLLLCEEGNVGNFVVADFALEHYACCCDLDVADLCLPPVALPDYRIADNVSTLSIDVINNDFHQNDGSSLAVRLINPDSDKGGTLTLSSSRGTIIYTVPANETGIDHFAYRLIDRNCGQEDIGHVYILLGQRRSVKGKGQLQFVNKFPGTTFTLLVDQEPLIRNFPSQAASPFLSLPAEREMTLRLLYFVTPSSKAQSFEFPLTLEEDKTYIAVIGEGEDKSTALSLALYERSLKETPPEEEVALSFFHGSPGGPALDLLADGKAWFKKVRPGAFQDYIQVGPEPSRLSLSPTGKPGDTIATFLIDLAFLKGHSAMLFTSGAVESDNFRLWASVDDGRIFPLPVLKKGDPGRGRKVVVKVPKIGEDGQFSYEEVPVKFRSKAPSSVFRGRLQAYLDSLSAVESQKAGKKALQQATDFIKRLNEEPALGEKEASQAFADAYFPLLAVYDKLDKGAKKSYQQALENVVLAFIDKLVASKPDGLSEAAARQLQKAVKLMAKQSIKPRGIKNRWKPQELVGDDISPTIAGIKKILV